VGLVELAKLCEGKSGAEIEGACRRAAVAAIREYLGRHAGTSQLAVQEDASRGEQSSKVSRYEDFVITRRHFVEAISEGE
jgi:SpoVK/Ycf46/Vps4 family AAA+-type ATPase